MKRFLILVFAIMAGTTIYAQRIIDKTSESICTCINERTNDSIAMGDLIPECAQEAFKIHAEKLEKHFGVPVTEGTAEYEEMTNLVVNHLVENCPAFYNYVNDEMDLSDWRTRCDTLIENGELKSAYDLATQVLEEDPENHMAYFVRGNVYALDEQYYRAVVQYLEAIDLKSDYLKAYTEMATAKSNVNDLEGAYSAIQKALEIDSTWAEAYNTLGTLYFKIDEYSSAVQEFRKAVRFDDEKSLYQYNLGVALQNLDRYQESIDILMPLAEKYPEDGSVFYELGNAWFGIDEAEKSLEFYLKACELRPENASYCDNTGFAYLEIKDNMNAIKWFEKSIELYPDDHEVIFTKGIAWFNHGNYEMALNDFEKAISINGEDYPGFYDYLGKTYKQMEKFDLAIKAFSTSLKLYPDDCDILKERAYCFESLLKEAEAEADRQKMLSLGCNEQN